MLLKIFCAVILIAGPFISGALPLSIFLPLLILTLFIVCYAIFSRSIWATKALVIIFSFTITLTACDLGARFFNIVPDDLIRRWPHMPLVYRYLANITTEDQTFSAYARVAGHNEWIEKKNIKLVTDAYGFRNEEVNPNRPLDVIMLGDSFAAGALSQQDTWTSILHTDHQLNTYNLSVPDSGPWHEYVNLWTEKRRLKTDERTNLVWQLFTGNDLDDYYGTLQLNELPWKSSIGEWLVRAGSLRNGSPVHHLLNAHPQNNLVLNFDFLNGRKLLFYRPCIESASRTTEQVRQHPNYEQLRATIHAVKGFADSQKLRLSLVLVPTKEEVYDWVWKGNSPWSTDTGISGFSNVLETICAEENIRYLNLKPSLVREARRVYEDSGQLLYWYDDPHLNSTGSRFTEELIYDQLLKGSQTIDHPLATKISASQ